MMQFRKWFYYIPGWFLMFGAALTMGLLSFSGILAIWPFALFAAIAACGLTMVYEGQIILKNTVEALKKLFSPGYSRLQLAKQCLLEYCFANDLDKRPQFFKDYERKLRNHHRFENKNLDEASRKRKEGLENDLDEMEEWFAEQLFSTDEGKTAYQKEVREWLKKNKIHSNLSIMEAFKAKQKQRYWLDYAVMGFCFVASIFMGVGTTYLLMEAFALIPWLATLSVFGSALLIVPLSLIAGVAYGLLVYNAVTDMIASEMVATWIKSIGDDFAFTPEENLFEEPSENNPEEALGLANIQNLDSAKPDQSAGMVQRRWWMGVAKISVLSFMFLVSLALSICTAGTWWTIVKSSKPLFSWMRKIPDFIKLVIGPLILSVSGWLFNLQNISETLEMAAAYFNSWFDNQEKTPANENQKRDEKEKQCSGFWNGSASIQYTRIKEQDKQNLIDSKGILFYPYTSKSKGKVIILWYCNDKGEACWTRIKNPELINLINKYGHNYGDSSTPITSPFDLHLIKTHLLSMGIQHETWVQKLNPFRLFIDYVFNPLRKLLFAAHLVGIGVTADQVPGIPPIISATFGTASEAVEDLHYFEFGQEQPHKHDIQSLLKERLSVGSEHDHGSDLPTKILLFLFTPGFLLATCWDLLFSFSADKFSSWSGFCKAFVDSWNKMYGVSPEETVEAAEGCNSCFDENGCYGAGSDFTDDGWDAEQAFMRAEEEPLETKPVGLTLLYEYFANPEGAKESTPDIPQPSKPKSKIKMQRHAFGFFCANCPPDSEHRKSTTKNDGITPYVSML